MVGECEGWFWVWSNKIIKTKKNETNKSEVGKSVNKQNVIKISGGKN